MNIMLMTLQDAANNICSLFYFIAAYFIAHLRGGVCTCKINASKNIYFWQHLIFLYAWATFNMQRADT